jgi:TonB-linked SusC/RagA family outer membrane protein
MKLFFTLLISCIFCSTSFLQDIALANTTSPISYSLVQNDRISLIKALSMLSDKYDIYFSYDVNTLKEETISKSKLRGNELAKELKALLLGTAFDFKKVGDKNYVIFKSPTTKQESKGEMIKKKIEKNSFENQPQKLSNRKIKLSPSLAEKIKLELSNIEIFSISGVVIDETGEPMIGVTIVEKDNPGNGTITGIDGDFSFNISAKNSILILSFIGYKKLAFNPAGKSQLAIKMSPDFQTLDEVMVVGFGTQQKRFTTGSISKVKAEDIQNATQNTIEGTLQGRVAGVQVTTSDAMAGSPVSIRIRGTSSVVASSEPLYVVDGVPIVTGNYSFNNASSWRLATAHGSNALAQLNPADIESIEILKDASAAAIYGSRGANGVVIITTKGGKKGKTKFDVGYQNGFSKETNRIKMLDGSTYLGLAKEAWTNSYNDALADNNPNNDHTYRIDNDYEKFWSEILPLGLTKEVAEKTNTDWIDQALQNGFFQEMNVAASGGSDKTIFYLGGTYRDEKGIFVGNNFKRYNARVNLDHKPTDFLTIGVRSAFTVTDNDIIPVSWAGGLGTAQSTALPFYPIFNEDGSFFNPQSGNNVVAELDNTEMNQKGTSILGNVYAELKFLKCFSLRSEFGVNNIYKKEFYYRSALIEPDAIATSVLSESINWNTNNTLSYTNSFGKHSFDILAGMNATKNNYFANVIDGETFPNPALKNPENAATQFSFLSFLSRINYRYDDKYLLGMSVRRDGSSRFGKGNRWGTFPAISLGWILSQEDFLAENKVVTFLKLRATYGRTGNAEIGNFEYFGSFQTNNYVDMPGIVIQEIDNNNLNWESTKQYDLGVDFGLFEGRVEGALDFYLKETTDLLTEIDISSLSGVERVTSNIGSLENKGFDLSLTSHNLTGKFKWVTDVNLAYNSNLITNLGGRDIIPGQFFGLGAVGVGYPVGARYSILSAGIAAEDMVLTVTDPDSGNPVEIQVQGGEELLINQFGEVTNIIDPNDQVFYGNPTPKWTGGLSNTFSWNNFDLSVLFTFATGHDLNNDEQDFQFRGFGYGWNMLESGLDRWQQPGDVTTMQRLTWQSKRFQSSRFNYSADYVRLRDLTIGYSFPSDLLRKWNLSNIRIYAKATNLLTFTKYPGWDPEYNRDGPGNVGQGKSWLPSPQAQSISFGFNMTF